MSILFLNLCHVIFRHRLPKQLKRADLHLHNYGTTVIRPRPPTLEYVSPLWHSTLTKSQVQCLEAAQRSFIPRLPFVLTLAVDATASLQARSLDHCKFFSSNICQPDSCLYHVSPPRHPAVTSRLRKPTTHGLYAFGEFALKDIVLQSLIVF